MSRAMRLAASTSLAVVLAACDGDRSPAAPSEGPPTLQMSGHVLDGLDNGVSGARVSVMHMDGPMVESVSDSAGAYALAIPAFQQRIYAVVEKSGYEESVIKVVGATNDITRDLRLHHILRVTAGQTVELAGRSDDPICGIDDYEFPCRRVRIVSQFAGQLRVDATSEGAAAHNIRLQSPGRSEEALETLRLAVTAGSETSIDVWFLSGATGTTLHTSLAR